MAIRVQLLCTDDVRSWGVDLYVYQVLNDYREQKVGTIEYPLSLSSYTLSFNGSVPERFLYKDDNHFDMRAVLSLYPTEVNVLRAMRKRFC